MRHKAAWLAASGHSNAALFRAGGKTGAVGGPLDPGDVARLFKAVAAATGIAPELVAAIRGHSSRIGLDVDVSKPAGLALCLVHGERPSRRCRCKREFDIAQRRHR